MRAVLFFSLLFIFFSCDNKNYSGYISDLEARGTKGNIKSLVERHYEYELEYSDKKRAKIEVDEIKKEKLSKTIISEFNATGDLISEKTVTPKETTIRKFENIYLDDKIVQIGFGCETDESCSDTLKISETILKNGLITYQKVYSKNESKLPNGFSLGWTTDISESDFEYNSDGKVVKEIETYTKIVAPGRAWKLITPTFTSYQSNGMIKEIITFEKKWKSLTKTTYNFNSNGLVDEKNVLEKTIPDEFFEGNNTLDVRDESAFENLESYVYGNTKNIFKYDAKKRLISEILVNWEGDVINEKTYEYAQEEDTLHVKHFRDGNTVASSNTIFKDKKPVSYVENEFKFLLYNDIEVPVKILELDEQSNIVKDIKSSDLIKTIQNMFGTPLRVEITYYIIERDIEYY